jgi:hypothetical protein
MLFLMSATMGGDSESERVRHRICRVMRHVQHLRVRALGE